MIHFIAFISIIFATKDIFKTHDFSIFGNTMNIVYLYDFVWQFSLYFIPIIFIYSYFKYVLNNMKYRNYIKTTDKYLLFWYEKYSFNTINYGNENTGNYLLFSILLFSIIHYINPELIKINISLNITILLGLKLFKTNNMSEKDVLEDFYKRYKNLYNIIGETKKDFGNKHFGLKYNELPEGYINWLAGPDFTPAQAGKNKQKFIIAKNYAEYKKSINNLPSFEEKIKEVTIESKFKIKFDLDTLIKYIT